MIFDIKVNSGENAPQVGFSEPMPFGGANTVRMSVDFEGGEVKPFTVSFKAPNRDSYSVWSPLHRNDRFLYPFWRTSLQAESSASLGNPLIQFIDKSGNNIFTVGISDFVSPVTIKGGIHERSGNIEINIEFFTQKMPPKEHYEVLIYTDERRIPYYDCIEAINGFRDYLGYAPVSVPEAAHRRLYSTWYAFQKDISAEKVYNQCVLAKEYGLDTVIIDDGWQTPCCGGGDAWKAYRTCGDWEPFEGKFPDMAGFIESLHNINMKAVLWIATPFIGTDSRVYEKFKGKLLGSHSGDGTIMIADPRFKEVRTWYAEMFCDRMKRWKLDGFKLDFINHFQLTDESSTCYEDMDYPDLGEATEKLVEEIHGALTAINPDAMIEFRQSYIGPSMQKGGNMFRVDDCAYGAMYNRVNGIDLRLSNNKSAIHSDMLMWDYSASVEAAADQLSALMFIVPQISMLFDRLPAEHAKMLKFWLGFIDENRDVLQFGRLVPLYPEANYPAVYAAKDGKVIAGLYSADSFAVPDETKSCIIVNASGRKPVYIDFGNNAVDGLHYEIKNCKGETTGCGEISARLGVYDIPYNGMIFIK